MKKQSGMGVASLVIGIISLLISCVGGGYLGILGVIFAIIAFTQKNKANGTAIGGIITSIIAIFLSLIFTFMVAIVGTSTDSRNTESKVSAKEEEHVEAEAKNEEEQKENEEGDGAEQDAEEEYIGIGSSFEKKGLKITVNDANLDFSDYSDEYGFYTPADGMKYIMVSFTFENTGKSDAYVSIYDFDCYADNTTCEQAYLPDDSDFINTNLSSGRNISFKTYYTVPVDAQSIELEYETNVWSGEKAIIKLQ